MSYQHVLNLDTVGGVEELFIHFLTHAKKLSSIQQHVLVTANKPHPFFVSSLEAADSVVVEKYIGPCKVPKFVRKWTRARALKNAHATTTVLWNRMESYPWPGNVIYYEHGASWIAEKSNHFFDSVDTILANSHAASRVLQLKWDIKSPITVIANPLKPTIKRAAMAKKAPQKMRLGYIGRLIPLKGVCLLLHAIKDLDVTLTIAGCGPEKENLVELAKKLGVSVTFLGAIKDVSGFYDSIDVLVVPSIREPLGLVAQEAALRGCPVLSSKVDGLPEVVQDVKTGFCIEPTLPLHTYSQLGGKVQNMPDLVYNPTSDTLTCPKLISPQDIAAKITTLIQNPGLYETMSQNAIEFASLRPNFLQYTESLLNNLQ